MEVRILQVIFTLTHRLNEAFELISSGFTANADVIIINADEPENIREWEIHAASNNLVRSIMVASQWRTDLGSITIQRPIRVQKLISALEELIEVPAINFREPESRAKF